jgi:hypothetical protein
MNQNEVLKKIWKYLISIQGWRTKRKIVVIESDDWGSIRMPSKDVYEKCLRSGYPVDKIAYESYDSLLSRDDIELLFDLLSRYKDNKGNHPVITANCVVANPDFEKIKQDNFRNYYYELITDTFKKYPNHADNYAIWKEGIRSTLFYPQYHAREHLNVSLFMDALRNGNEDVHFGFKNRMPGCIGKGPGITGNIYVEPTNYNSKEDKEQKLRIFLEGLDIFEKLFGYKSESIIPPSYTWSNDFNDPIQEKGVKFIQGIRKYREPMSNGIYKYHTMHTGKRTSAGQIYLARNCLFEPSLFKLNIKDPVTKCLSDMSIAFKMHKPAILSSHRINFVGFIDESNRDNNLISLNDILSISLRRWPDLEFMTSEQLGNIIMNHEKY